MDNNNNKTEFDEKYEIYIERNTLITLNCTQGPRTNNFHRLLQIYCYLHQTPQQLVVRIQQNKVPLEEWFKQRSIISEDNKMYEYSKSYHEVKLEKYGHFEPHFVFNIGSMKDIVSVHYKSDAI